MSDVVTERVGRVLVATINRASRSGSIGGDMMAQLLDAAATVHMDPELGALVVASNGPIWSSGGDPDALQSGFGPGAKASHLVHREKIGGETGLRAMSGQALAFDTLGVGAWLQAYRECGKPLIAAIDGPAVGGGFALALAHDIRIVSEKARFLSGFSRVGVGPELGTSWVLPQLVGSQRAAGILMFNRWITADEALEYGLVNDLVPSATLLNYAIEAASQIVARPVDEVMATVRALRGAGNRTLEQQLQVEWDSRRAAVMRGASARSFAALDG